MKLVNSTRAGAVCLGLVAAALAATSGEAAAATSPNIVLVVADDLGYDQTSLYGRPGSIQTPNLESIGDTGVRLTQGYVASPVCSPSRSALLTGREPARVGADSNFLTRARPERMPTDTFASRLPAQYSTMAIGKWDLAGTAPFDANHLPAKLGYDNFYGFFAGQHSYCAPNDNLKEYDPATDTYLDRTNDAYLTDDLTDHAVSYINDHASSPFFLYLAYNAPHLPLESPTSCGGTAQSDQDKFAEMVQTMDNGVGQVRQALANNGITDNTLVIFLSDNGQQTDYFTGPTRGGKYTLFEGGIKVPFAMSWPDGLPGGTTYDKPISSLDLYRTVLAAAGVTSGIPSDVQGTDLTPYLNEQDPGSPNPQLSWRYVADEAIEGLQGETLVAQRSGDQKWIRTTTPASSLSPSPVTTNYFFDLTTNPGESDSQNQWPGASGPLLATHNAWNAANPLTESFKNARDATDIRANKPDGFIEAGGTWTVVDAGTSDKSYRGTSSGLAGRSMLEPSYYADAKVTSTLRLVDPGQAGVIVRGSGAGEAFSGYVATLAVPQNGSACAGPAPQSGGGSSRVVLSKVVNGTGTVVACKDLSLSTGTDYLTTVQATGNTLTVSVAGVQQLAWTDTSAQPFTGGRVGLRVLGTSATSNTRAEFATLNASSN